MSKSGEYVLSVQDGDPSNNYSESGPYSLLVRTTDGTEVRSLTLPSDANPGGAYDVPWDGNFDVVGLTDDGLYAFIMTWGGGFTGSSVDTLAGIHRIDLRNGDSVRVDVDAQGVNTGTHETWSFDPVDFDMTPDGSRVVMAIRNTVDRNTVDPHEPDPDTDGIYLKDLSTGSLTQLDAAGVTGGGGYSQSPRISDDGQRVLFTSDKSNLPGGTGWQGLYIFDGESGQISHVPALLSHGGEIRADISGNGEYVAYTANGRVYRLELETGDSLSSSRPGIKIPTRTWSNRDSRFRLTGGMWS